jgi:acetyl esterase/lipase
MDAQTKFTHFLLKLINAKKLASKTMLRPKRAKQFKFPQRLKKYQIDRFLVQNRNVITFNPLNRPVEKHIIFLHGGAYTVEENSGHWWMLEQIVKLSDFKISFFQYPLAPENNYKQTHFMLAEAYSELTNKNPDDRFYFLGDSAGGGLCLAFAQMLRDKAQKMPKKIALLSPWLDLSLTNPEIRELEQRDLLLSAETLKKCASWYADGTDLKSPLLSPLYGNLEELNSIGIFVGTEEILLPDCRLLRQKIEKSDANLFYKEYEGMQHDWIVFPIKERHILLNDVIRFIGS